MIRDTIKEKAKFDINDIEPKVFAERCFIPALFCHGLNDSFVNVHHCKDLYDVYAGDKNVTYVEGDHNSMRPNYFLDSVAIFFHNALHVENLKELNYDEKIGDIKNINPNKEEENKEGNNNNNQNNFGYENINEFQDDYGYMGQESEEDILQRVLELSKKEY